MFTPCSGEIDAALIEAHLRGDVTLATYLVEDDGRAHAAVIDLDATARTPDGWEMAPVEAASLALAADCRRAGIDPVIEASGRRGRHLWMLFTEPAPAEAARRLARALAARLGGPRPGLRVEILPRHTDWPGPELGDAVKLPLGLHPATGRFSALIDADGEPANDPLAMLAQVRKIVPAEIPALIHALGRLDAGAPPAKLRTAPRTGIDRLVANCAVVRAIAERANEAGHLRHTHQLILLYTAGHLGAEGAEFIHRTISPCRNYDARICQSYIDRMEPSHPPISCARIREWLEEEGEAHWCVCSRDRRSPVETPIPASASTGEQNASSKRNSAPARPTTHESVENQAWSEVAADLFGREAVSPQDEG